MNRSKNMMRKFNLQTFAGGTSIARTDAEALIPVQESHESQPSCSAAAGWRI